jgi:hypothetical protein
LFAVQGRGKASSAMLAIVRTPSPRRRRTALITGIVAASATAGVIEGFARREHLAVFAGIGRQLCAVIEPSTDPTATTAIVLGVGLHLLLALFWGALFALVASRLEGLALTVASLVGSAAIWAINSWWAPPLLRFGNDLTAFAPQAVVFYLALAGALLLGMRLAREPVV